MKAVDTNVLARFVLRDDAEQALKATRFFAEECSASDPGFVNRIVLCELVWVFERLYKLERAQIHAFLIELLHSRSLLIEDHEAALLAAAAYENGSGFADIFLAETNRKSGNEYTVTFDRKAARHAHFRLL